MQIFLQKNQQKNILLFLHQKNLKDVELDKKVVKKLWNISPMYSKNLALNQQSTVLISNL
ncbi:Uncharacterised protein [Mycobacterium tuberculosis]|nr:Uncharacterised protein [Mycobacterium tuberculosis]